MSPLYRWAQIIESWGRLFTRAELELALASFRTTRCDLPEGWQR